MPWIPAHKTINARAIADNLLGYIAANQADALTWAGGGFLRLIKQFSNSVANRTDPVYPSIAFMDDNDAQAFSNVGDEIQGAYSVTFEIAVQSDNPDTAVAEARLYSAAVVSMIRNCPGSALITNTGADRDPIIDSIEVGFAEIRTNEMQNDFLQIFQVRSVYQLAALG